MKAKRILRISIAVLLVAMIGVLIEYQHATASLYANFVPVVKAKADTFVSAIAAPPETIQPITEEEYNAAVAQEDAAATPEPATSIAPEESEAIYQRVEITDRVYNVLLLGDDARINEPRARSDTMILLSYNRDTRVINVVSFMRDMFVPTTTSGSKWAKINTAYAEGGAGKAINTVNNCFSLDVQRYVIVRFATVFTLIDKLDGLDLTLTKAEAGVINGIFPEYKKCVEGMNHLNGRQVLAYARMRHVSQDGDFSRTQRQRYVIRAVADKVLASNDAKNYAALLQYMLDNVETNVPMDEIITMGMEIFTGEKPAMEELRLPVDKGFNYGHYNGSSVLTVDFKKNITALQEFLYGTAEGVRIPKFTQPTMDTPAPFVTMSPDGTYPQYYDGGPANTDPGILNPDGEGTVVPPPAEIAPTPEPPAEGTQ